MVQFWHAITFGLAALAAASPVAENGGDQDDWGYGPPGGVPGGDKGRRGKGNGGAPACGKLNFVFTGLPWNHPAVQASGFTPQQVEAGIRADMKAIVQAGYNIKAVLVGPENGLEDISRELKGTDWTGTGVGFGIRGNPSPVITKRFIDIVQLFRDEVPRAPILFNYSPNSSVWAIQQYFPLPKELDCSNKPGKDLGIAIHCKACNPPV